MHFATMVIGGGPAGTTLATTLARAGRHVVLFDRSEPRPPFGQALRPGVIPVLDAIGVYDAVASAGFPKKSGSTHWGWGRTPEWDLWFADSEAYDHAWFVDRPRLDAILMDHAKKSGVEVFERATVKRLLWDGDTLEGVEIEQDGETLVAYSPFIVDATGRAQLIARARGLVEPIPGLRHQAYFAHWEGVRGLPPPRHAQALFLAEERHWFWVFPIAEAQWSIGMVLLDDDGEEQAPQPLRVYEAALAGSAKLMEVIGPEARRVTPVQRRRDWSYRVKQVAGPGWFCIGDAGGFIDPVLAQGVVTAFVSGYQLGRTLLDAFAGKITGAEAAEKYQREHGQLMDDLIQMLRFFYTWEVERDDYFWESKRILAKHKLVLKPQKAFAYLTSGLIRNLALDEKRGALEARRELATASAATLDGRSEVDSLDFVGVHFLYHHVKTPGQFHVLIEPADRTAPSLFRTTNWDVNVMSRLFKDPLRDPVLSRALHAIGTNLKAWDDRPDEPLVDFWKRIRGRFADLLGTLPKYLVVKRVYGE
jgi:flavin-dependent dehydrogenase